MTAGRRLNPVYVRNLTEAHAGRASLRLPWIFMLTFGKAEGLQVIRGHKITAVLSGNELADAIGSIPASTFDDDEDLKAVIRLQALLRRPEFNEEDAAG